MFKDLNPAIYRQISKQIKTNHLKEKVRYTFFPDSIILWCVLFAGWILSFIILAISYQLIKKISPLVLSLAAVPLIPCYFLSFLNIRTILNKEKLEMTNAEFLKGTIQIINRSLENQAVIHHVTTHCPGIGNIALPPMGTSAIQEGDICYIVLTNDSPLGMIDLTAKLLISFGSRIVTQFIEILSAQLFDDQVTLIFTDNETLQGKPIQQIAEADLDRAGDNDSWEPQIYHQLEKIEWSEVILQEEVKREINRALKLMTEPKKFMDLKKKAPKGLLLYGPPGTGKTTIAKVIASQANMTFIPISPGELLNGIYGTSERRVRKLFRRAKQSAPCVVFIDEVDGLLMKRGSNSLSTFKDDILTEFLKEMDGVVSDFKGKVIIIGATNRRDRLDEAAIRPGRFDKQIMIPLPDEVLRERLWQLFLNELPCEKPIDYSTLAKESSDFSGAEIQGAVEEAKDMLIDRRDVENNNAQKLSSAEFFQGIDKIRRNKMPNSITQSF